jgi:hypothetical protein
MAEHLAVLEYDNIVLLRSAAASTKRERVAAAAATLRGVLRAAQRLTLALSWGRWMSVVVASSQSGNMAEHMEETICGGISHISHGLGGAVMTALSTRNQRIARHNGSGGASSVDSTLLGTSGKVRVAWGQGDDSRSPRLHQRDSAIAVVPLAHDAELLSPPFQPRSRSSSRSPSLNRATMRNAQR